MKINQMRTEDWMHDYGLEMPAICNYVPYLKWDLR